MWDPLRHLIDSDEELGFVVLLPFRYDTGLWRGDPRHVIPTFDTVADSLKEFLDTEAQSFSRLMVLSHSQGGLVVQRYLTRMTAEGRGADLRRIRRIVMLACPNNGSEIALALRRRLLRRNPQERELRPLNERIADTQRAVLRDIVNATEVTARSCPIHISVYAGESDGIVPPASARSVFPDAAVLPGDHFGIAKPDNSQHRTYTTLRRLILLTSSQPQPITGEGSGAPSAAAPSSAGASGSAATQDGAVPARTATAASGTASLYDFPDVFAIVAAAEAVSGMDEAGFRLLVIRLMRQQLPSGFSVAYREHTRDHLVEIVERCRTHRDARAALLAFRDVVAMLRPDEAATDRLRALIGDGG